MELIHKLTNTVSDIYNSIYPYTIRFLGSFCNSTAVGNYNQTSKI